MSAKITSHANAPLAADVPRSIAVWTEKVGFRLTGSWGEPPDFAILMRDVAYVMVGAAPRDHTITPLLKIRPNLWNAYFWVDGAKAKFAEMNERGAKIDYDLCTQPYNVLEFGIQDLDGHDIAFGEVPNKTASSTAQT